MDLTHLLAIVIAAVASAFVFLRLRLQVSDNKLTRMETKTTDDQIKADAHSMSDDDANAELRKNIGPNNTKL